MVKSCQKGFVVHSVIVVVLLFIGVLVGVNLINRPAIFSPKAQEAYIQDRLNFSVQIARNECIGGSVSVELVWDDLSSIPGYSYTLSIQDNPNEPYKGMGTTQNRYFGVQLLPNKSYIIKIGVLSNGSLVGETIVPFNTRSCGESAPNPPPPTTTSRPVTDVGLQVVRNQCVGEAVSVEWGWNDLSRIQGYSYVLSMQNNPNEPFQGMGTTYNRYFGATLVPNKLYSMKVALYSNNKLVTDDIVQFTTVSCAVATPEPTFRATESQPTPAPTVASTPTLVPTTPAPTPMPTVAPQLKRGNLNNDTVVNVLDFAIMLSRWGSTDADADLNGDGKVTIADFSILLSNWGN